MNKKQRVALLGCGFIGEVHAANLQAHPGVELVWVADAEPTRAAAFATRFGARAASVTEAINDEQIDMVLIASATPTHADLLEAAARAGKAIYCEKPVDLSLERARSAVANVLPYNVPVTVGFNRRFDVSHQQLKQQLRQGRIGPAELIQMVCRSSAMPPLAYLQASGGQMRDQAIHFFDLLRWLTEEEVTEVAAMGAALALPSISEFDDVDTSTLLLRLQGGALAQLDNVRRTGYGYDERISVMGPHGMLESASQPQRGVSCYQGAQIQQPGLLPDWFSRVQPTYYAHLDAFIRSLNGEQVDDLPGLEDGLKAQAIAEAAVISLAERRFCAVEKLPF
ncbi:MULTISPECIES: Gfo/Idh/MocA family oxidoreductase [Pantoea]|uniref:Gfo/Idh/MocA family oxidoreductase n=1 Tax=Pantoea TaxID=53335 RepID=UPI0006DD3916|nr:MULTISPECIES: Gfo/Idh/MocA family oxidoreductase [Pantoea]KPA04981.1 oxidoreductase [Pantoea agglomerans]MCW0977087.1 Gfo/Idh/MocA family oxidoreductase [Pantoea sp. JV6]MCX2908384.1 Gfo/Idh/MocA family oxidoreductase [[Curtobacterium] plantarum]